LSVLRILRLSRVARLLRFSHVAEHVHELHVLLHSLWLAIRGLAWSVLLITGFIFAGSAVMVQLGHAFLDDSSISLERRQWVWNNFGTVNRAVYTLWECTFTNSWTQYSRPLIEEVSSTIFGPFWLCYIVGVNFTLMKVVGALFLKQTLQVAQADEARLEVSRLKRRQILFSECLSNIFAAGDESGDGAISDTEFHAMILDDHVVQQFASLGLHMDDVLSLFTVLAADQGAVNFEEFLDLSLHIKDSARKIDIVQNFQFLVKIDDQVKAMTELMQMLILSLTKARSDNVLGNTPGRLAALLGQPRAGSLRS